MPPSPGPSDASPGTEPAGQTPPGSASAPGATGRGARFASASGPAQDTTDGPGSGDDHSPSSPATPPHGGRFAADPAADERASGAGRRFSAAPSDDPVEASAEPAAPAGGPAGPGTAAPVSGSAPGGAELTPLLPPAETVEDRPDQLAPVAPWARPWQGPASTSRSGTADIEDTVSLPRPSVPGAAQPTSPAPAVAPPGGTDEETRILPRTGRSGRKPAAARAAEPQQTDVPKKRAAAPKAARPERTAETAIPAPAETSAGSTRRRSLLTRRTVAIGGGVAALVVALVLTLVLVPRSLPGASVSPTADASQIDALAHTMLQPSELGSIASTTWAVASSTETFENDTPRPQCIDPAALATSAEALREQVLQGSGDDDPVVLQLVQTYADPAAATTAFAEISTALGTCAPGPAFLAAGLSVSNLADEATGVVVDALDTDFVRHTILATRTGESIAILDVAARSGAPDAKKIVAVAQTALARLCEAGGGTCPASPGVTDTPPPAGSTKGWLEAADLPRVKSGAGTWAGTSSTISSATGTQCENVDLSTVSGPKTRAARSYVLAGDSSAPVTFGVDMISFTFSDANAATSFGNTLRTNIANCGDRTRTATVSKPVDVTGTGQGNAKVTGQSFELSQAPDKTLYRVAVLNVGSRVVFLRATPSSSFDFSDQQWATLALRAVQRASQG